MTGSSAAGAALSERGAARLLPGRASWLAGGLAAIVLFVAVIALGVAVAGDRAASAWSDAVAETATLSVIAEEAEIEAQARAALSILRETPGVREVRVLDPAEQRRLLAPYLGTGIAFDATALPLMMEVETDRAVLDRSALDARLAAEAPGAVFDDHSAWRLPLAAAAARQRDLAATSAGLLLATLAGIAAMAARDAAETARGPIRTLKRLGFPDPLLRRVLVARVARALTVGAAAGATAASLLAGGIAPDPVAAGFDPGFVGWTWALPPLALLLGLGLATAIAAYAADRMLRRWP